MLKESYKDLPRNQRMKLERSNRLLDNGRVAQFDSFLEKCTTDERTHLSENIRRYYIQDPRRPTTSFYRLPSAPRKNYRNAS